MKETLAQHWRVIALTLIALAVACIGGVSSGILSGTAAARPLQPKLYCLPLLFTPPSL